MIPKIVPARIRICGKNLTAPLRFLTLPGLVLPIFSRSDPECPLEVAKTAELTDIVLTVFVTTVVGKDVTLAGTAGSSATSATKTRAKPGAGTVILQLFATWSQVTVSISKSPTGRPSDAKLPPNVWNNSCQLNSV